MHTEINRFNTCLICIAMQVSRGKLNIGYVRLLRDYIIQQKKGYPGDEDQGGMSSWYILSSLGIYAVCPGTDEYVIGSPLFKKATITMENGNKFVIEAPENSKENLYIQSATLNGRLLDKNYIHYDDIAEGGVLKFEMGSQPNKERCTSKYAAPFSLSKE